MKPCTIDGIQAETLAETRKAVYRFLLAALDKPSPRQHAWFQEDSFRQTMNALCDEFFLEKPESVLAAADYSDHESRYIASFEVGMPEPPVVLTASHHNAREPVSRIIHEHLLFYRRFGAKLIGGNIEQADHLLNELAFLIHLDELLAEGKVDTLSVLSGRRDFLKRHATNWTEKVAKDARKKPIPRVYTVLLRLLAAALTQDLEITETMIASYA